MTEKKASESSTLRGEGLEIGKSRLRGALAKSALSGLSDTERTSIVHNDDTSQLKGSLLDVDNSKEELESEVFISVKNGRRYVLYEVVDRSDKGRAPLARVQSLYDGGITNILLDKFEERFTPEKE